MKIISKMEIGAKVICILMTVCMLSLTACTNSSNTPSPTQSGAGFQVTNEPTKAQEHTGVNEPHHEIDPGVEIASPTPEPTAEPTEAPDQSGKYSYTVYGTTLSMDINIDDYILVNDNGKFFKLYRFAHDALGWTTMADGTDNAIFSEDYWHESENFSTYVSIGHYEESMPGSDYVQFRSISIRYTKDGCDWMDGENNCSYSFGKHYDSCDYRLIGTGWCVSYEDIVILAYVLWSESVNPGVNSMVQAFGANSDYASGLGNYKLP